jgi:hypothetical protein
MKDDFICALSGLSPSEEQEDNEIKGVPEGWIEITVKRHFVNPRYVALQQLKDQMIQASIAQLPPEVRREAAIAIELEVEAKYSALESKIKEHITEEDTIYVSTPENDGEILGAYKEMSENLGFDPLLYEEDEEEEEENLAEIEAEDTQEAEPQEETG